MDKIMKILRKLSKKEQEALLLLMEQLKLDYTKVPGVRALTGKSGWFRVRIGAYRIIFSVKAKSKKVEIRRVTRRNEKTYKRLK